MNIFYLLLWVLLGPGVGYYVAHKRGGSMAIGIGVGILAGPCLAWLFVPVVMSFFDSGGSKPLPQKGAGRSFGVDEDPQLGGKK